jgi:DNA modification methylase
MTSAFDIPDLFSDAPVGTASFRERKPSAQRWSARPGGRQLGMFSETTGDIRDGFDLDLAPLDATFRDSSEAPLHSWFPYIEGYSPRFVERVRNEYLRDAKRIIEPFAGTGTTPIVLGQAGVECAFSEANPAMIFIAKTKLVVLGLPEAKRKALAKQLSALGEDLPRRVFVSLPDERLRGSYAPSFANSVFFNAAAFEAVLRLRTVNDALSAEDGLLGDCFAVAVLSSLIPSSLLKRAGDLRYRTPKELSAGLPSPVDEVCSRLVAQATDLLHSEPLQARAQFACPTAGALHEHLDAEWDGVITSPPYLNGTNYIRNARLELWYLRHLTENADLRRLRDRVITSGINDVHARTRWQPITSGVERVVRAIEQNAYDSRIAKMVGGYFHDMAAVFASVGQCLRPGGRMCIDIGDSIYNRVHVPTDDLLVEVAESMGFQTVERVHLRKRTSKGGIAVRQQLLVFERQKTIRKLTAAPTATPSKENRQPPVKAVAKSDWRKDWETFKTVLPHQHQPYAKREWGGPAHSMCSYQGKMKPALAHHLVKCFSSPGDVVIDPFSGAGTIPLEACRMGRKGYGLDISRLGHVLTLAKVAKSSPQKLETLLCELEAHIGSYSFKSDDIERAAAVRFNSAIPDYFHSETLREVIAARSFFLSRWITAQSGRLRSHVRFISYTATDLTL